MLIRRLRRVIDKEHIRGGRTDGISLKLRLLIFFPILAVLIAIELLSVTREWDIWLLLFGAAASFILMIWVIWRAFVGFGATSSMRSERVARRHDQDS